jgi:hypothetical protein
MNIEKLDFETIEHEKVPFTLIHTTVIQTITDHFAGFIWVYLHSLPSDWRINKTHLLKHFDIGEDKLKKHMAYLNKTRLIEYVRTRDIDGTLSVVTIRVLNGLMFDPNSKTSTGVKTTLVDLTTGVIIHPVVDHTSGFYPPLTKTIDLTNNNTYTNNKKNTEMVKKTSMQLSDVLGCNPFNISEMMLEDWLSIRESKRAIVTATAWDRLNKELDKCLSLGISPNEAFETMVANGWSSLKADWLKNKKITTKSKLTTEYDNTSTEWIKDINKDMF